jgi:protein tyrosine/serine phosphatase
MYKKLLVLCITLNLSACISTKPLPPEKRPATWGNLVNKDLNFYKISEDVFRSEQPSNQLIPLIKQNNISVIINLRSKNEDVEVLSQESLNLKHIPINTWEINRDDLLSVMKEIEQAKLTNQKALIHCYHGSDRTGASIAMYRIIFENWSTQDALEEMKYGGYGFHPIWVNIEKLFSPENIKWIQQQLSNPS